MTNEELSELAKCQDVCPNPECENGKVYSELTPWSCNEEDCPTCKGTGKKQDPDREILARRLAEYDNWRFDDLMEKPTSFNSGVSKFLYRNRASSILALFGDVRKKERARTIKEVEDLIIGGRLGEPEQEGKDAYFLEAKGWQALKESNGLQRPGTAMP